MSAANLGKTLSPAHREKIRQALRERPPNLQHGFFAAPPYPIRTADDLRRWLTEIQARLSALLEQVPTDTPAEVNHWANLYSLYGRNLTNLTRLLRDQWQAQADAEAAERFFADFLRDYEEMMKEEGEEEKKEPTQDKPAGG
jgi:hypothetical protein